jgi:hypothetical protein
MLTGHIRLAVVFMAIDARELRKIRCDCMAISAECPSSTMFAGVNLEILAVMIKCRRRPCCRGMAGRAIVRVVCQCMIRVCRSGKIGAVALVAA